MPKNIRLIQKYQELVGIRSNWSKMVAEASCLNRSMSVNNDVGEDTSTEFSRVLHVG